MMMSVGGRRSWIGNSYNVVRYTRFDRGGHFASLEQPQLLADDIIRFFQRDAPGARRRTAPVASGGSGAASQQVRSALAEQQQRAAAIDRQRRSRPR